jgi:predicted metal-dependent peptidase
MDNLVKAKAALILDQPFFASLLLGMDIKEDNSIPTMATNGDYILYNKKFLESMTLGETIFALSHEVLHAAFQHMHRRENRHPKKWNIACDYVINDLLVKEKIGTMVKGALHDSQLVQNGGGTSEGVYKLMPDDPSGDDDNRPGPGQPGGSMDDMQDAGHDDATREQKQAEMKVKVAQAANAAKMCGKLSSGIERFVKQVTKSKTDWRYVLRRFFTERAKNEYSYAKPKRRFMAEDLYLPGLNGETCGAIAIAVDCSGSIDDHMVEMFAKEIKAIIEDVKPQEVNVIYFDHDVVPHPVTKAGHDTFTQDDEFEIAARGGGGTRFSPVFDYIENKGLNVTACIFLTDLVCNDFGSAPSYPVLWCTTYAEKAPFGEVLKLTE